MKVEGPSRAGAPAGGPSRAGAAPGFSALVPGGGTAPAAPVSAAAGVVSVDALMALQQAEGPLERRRRSVARAGTMLDLLDEVKLALLDGQVGLPALERLARAVRTERAATDDPGLEGVLDQIETRAQVELAKLEARRAAA
jgi:hypothetical protein